MIDDPTKFNVGKMEVDVNWESSVTPCKKIRFKFNGVTEVIDREDLYAMLMLFGNEEQQEFLIPVQQTKVRAITRMLKIRATKDIKKGETIRTPYTYWIPEGVYERLLRNPNEKMTNADLSTNSLEKIVNKDV